MSKENKLNILVTGSNGQLGSEINVLSSTSNHRFYFTDVAQLDITNLDAVNSFFETNKIGLCINCAAYTAVDKAESDKELCDKVNVIGPQNLAKACNTFNAVMIHISTDFVFSGEYFKPIHEDEATNPVNYYGVSKLNGEKSIAKELKQHFIIRTSWLYSSFGANFVKTMINLGSTRSELNVIVDQIGTPTYARDLAQTILKMIDSKSDSFGVYHYSNEGIASWYDFAHAVFENKNIEISLLPIPTTSYPTPAKRPHYSVMDKTKIRATFNLTIPNWRDSLKECIDIMN